MAGWIRIGLGSIILDKSGKVLRLRSGEPSEKYNAFRLAPLRMTELEKSGLVRKLPLDKAEASG
jgi:hypothetical protein